ncbi:MAG: OmpA family protein [Gammaproteobacteria bacterium]
MIIVSVLSVWGSMPLQAHDYLADVDQSAWFVEPSPLMCRLRHSSRRAVEVVETASFETWAPAWRHDAAPQQLGVVAGEVGTQPVHAGAALASTLLDELEMGLFPVITHRGWRPGHRVQVAISAVNFQDAYVAFQDCLAGLFPVGFDQVERTSVLFAVDKDVVTEMYLKHIQLIARYMMIDASVRAVVIDGHTDSVGRAGYNWDLSRRRAEAVRAVLIQSGVPEDQVVLRYHGESLPIAPNSLKSGRDRNRRVTLRLEREML